MKKLGLIGGIGPESTLLYYKKIVFRLQEKVAANFLPNLTIESLNVFDVLEFCDRNDLSGLADYLMCGINNLINSGSEVIALTGNTPHIVFEELQERSPVPLISIIEATLIEAQSKKYSRVGLIGTKATMQSNLFNSHCSKQNMDIIVPTQNEQLFISKIITEELEYGVVSINSQDQFIKIIKRMKNDEGIEAIILGCTELPLLFKNIQTPVDLLDTVEIHVNAIIEYLIDSNY